jgi:hypothetical protein
VASKNNARENQRFLIDSAELCIQQWAGLVIRRASGLFSQPHRLRPLFCAAGYFSQPAVTSLVVGADVIDATRGRFFKRRYFRFVFYGLSGWVPGAGLICAFERTIKGLP